jgi:hypothetical protein
MKTKSQVKSSQSKSTAAPQSKLASFKGAVTSAIFGSGKKQPVKSASPSKTPAKSVKGAATAAKTAAKTAPTKAPVALAKGAVKAAAKGANTPAAAKTSAQAAPKAAPSGKGAKAAGGAQANTKTVATPATIAKSGKGQLPGTLSKPAEKSAKAKGAANGASSVRSSMRALGRHNSDEVCREVACEGLSTSGGYCRLHYIKNWKKIKRKELILKEGKLNQYIEELVAKYPDKYIEAIRQDLAEDKAFAKVIYDLDLDETSDDFEGDGENVDNLIDTIKRDFDDEGDAF